MILEMEVSVLHHRKLEACFSGTGSLQGHSTPEGTGCSVQAGYKSDYKSTMGQSPAGVSRFTKSSARWVVETTIENVTGLLGLQAPPTRSETVLIYARRGLYGTKTDPNKNGLHRKGTQLTAFLPLYT